MPFNHAPGKSTGTNTNVNNVHILIMYGVLLCMCVHMYITGSYTVLFWLPNVLAISIASNVVF